MTTPGVAFAVVTGGGTSGHVLAAVAVADALVARGHQRESIHMSHNGAIVKAAAARLRLSLLDVAACNVTAIRTWLLPTLVARRGVRVTDRRRRPKVVVKSLLCQLSAQAADPGDSVLVSATTTTRVVSSGLHAARPRVCRLRDRIARRNDRSTGRRCSQSIEPRPGRGVFAARLPRRFVVGLRWFVGVPNAHDSSRTAWSASPNGGSGIITSSAGNLSAPRRSRRQPWIMYRVLGYEPHAPSLRGRSMMTRAGAATIAGSSPVAAAVIVPWRAAENHQVERRGSRPSWFLRIEGVTSGGSLISGSPYDVDPTRCRESAARPAGTRLATADVDLISGCCA